jgi:hypothetical protein
MARVRHAGCHKYFYITFVPQHQSSLPLKIDTGPKNIQGLPEIARALIDQNKDRKRGMTVTKVTVLVILAVVLLASARAHLGE